MKKYLLVYLFFFLSWLDAQLLDVKYRVEFGALGELGILHAHLETKGNRYTIFMDAKATGLAKTLSKNRKETHLSEGFVRDGRYYTERYSVLVEYGKKKREKVYTVDYQKKIVSKSYKKYRKGKLISHTESTLDFFGVDDLLTLYFNLPKILDTKSKPGLYTFEVIGTEQQNGKMELCLPKPDQLKKYTQTLGEGAYRYLAAIIYQKIFSRNKGELMIAVDKEGIIHKAVLKNLVMFGDLTVERIK